MRHRCDTSAGRLELRSTGAVLDGRHIPLSRTGIDLLGVLFEARGGGRSRAQSLQSALPRSGDNTHAVEMAVARVREALGVPDLIKTVVKRGYRLNVLDPADDLLTRPTAASNSDDFRTLGLQQVGPPFLRALETPLPAPLRDRAVVAAQEDRRHLELAPTGGLV